MPDFLMFSLENSCLTMALPSMLNRDIEQQDECGLLHITTKLPPTFLRLKKQFLFGLVPLSLWRPEI
jgi:hypothetical protein